MELSNDDRRTQMAYDLVAEDYSVLLATHLDDNPWERDALDTFAQTVHSSGGGLVLDAGCGPGRLAGPLRHRGLDVRGVDLSSAMVAQARRAHPDLHFEVGSLQALDLSDGALAGILAWYSVIHTAPALQPVIWREFARVLRPGGHVMVGFQVGDRCDRLDHAYGHDIDLDAHRLSVDLVADQLTEADLSVISRVERGPVEPERHGQAYLLAQSSPSGTCSR